MDEPTAEAIRQTCRAHGMAELDIASYLNSEVRRAEKLLGNLDAATARQLMLSNEVALILLHYRFGGVAH